MKKIVALLLIAIAIPMGLMATGQEESGGTDISKTVPVTFYMKGSESPDQRVVFDMIEQQIAETVNVELDFNWLPYSDYKQKIQVLLASGDGFEMALDNSWGDYYSNVGKGNYMDLTDMIPEYMPSYYSKMKEALNYTKYKGRIYSVPNAYRQAKAGRDTLYVRGDLWEKYYGKEIKTMDDVEAYLAAIKANVPDIVPISEAVAIGNMFNLPYYRGFGYVFVHSGLGIVYHKDDPDMTLMAFEEIPEYAEILEQQRRWYTEGYWSSDLLAPGEPDILKGEAASFFHGGFWVTDDADALAANGIDGYTKGFPIYPDSPQARGDLLASTKIMNINADQAERALMFLDWVHTSQENFDLFAYGTKGTHWEEMEDGRWRNLGGDTSKYPWWASAWYFEDGDFLRPTEQQNPETLKIEFAANNDNSFDPPHMGMAFDYNPVKTEVANRTALWEEYGKALYFGVTDPAGLEDYLKKQKAAGTPELLATLQAQLDEWRTTK